MCDTDSKYQSMLQINNAIVKETTPGGLFKRLALEISRLFHYDRFSINLYSPEKASLSYFATSNGVLAAGKTEGECPLTKCEISNEVIRLGKPLTIYDMSAYTHWESVRSMKAAGLKSVMVYPLIMRDRVLGTIDFSFFQRPEDVENLHELLVDLSKQVAVAADNMLAHTKLKHMYDHVTMQKDYLLEQEDDYTSFFYASPKMQSILQEVAQVADSDISVLITGETGTGKDHIAHQIHALSGRKTALMVKVNCPALTPSLFESELFGHAKGAFTGANNKRTGRFEMADGGTVFLDEIGELEPALQAKLLNVLQEKSFERVGESSPIKVDFRLISATNQKLEKLLNEGVFRRDLFYRLNTFSIHVPPLRERPEDIPVLVKHLNAAQAKKTRQPEPIYDDSCLQVMQRYYWPGNVRELKNLIERLILMCPGELIKAQAIERMLPRPEAKDPSVFLSMQEMEKKHIMKALELSRGTIGGPYGAASLLGLPRQTLQYRIKKHGLIAQWQ